jgi:hypothetical protein
MSQERRPLAHLLRGIEELMQAGADAAATLRERAESQQGELAEDWLGGLARLAMGRDGRLAPALRQALEAETERWRERAPNDRAARRVLELFEAILDLLSDEEPSERPAERQRSRAPRRAVLR